MLKYFREGYRLDPNNVDLAVNHHDFLVAIRRFREAAEVARHLIKISPEDLFQKIRLLFAEAAEKGSMAKISEFFGGLNPEEITVDPYAYQSKLIFLVFSGEAESYVRQWERIRPKEFDPAFWRNNEYYGIFLKLTGRHEEARAVSMELLQSTQSALEENPENTDLQMQLGRILACLGEEERSMAILDELKESFRQSDRLLYYDVINDKIRSLIHLGRDEAALDLLLGVTNKPYSPHPLFMETHLDYLPLQGHPRFKGIVENPDYKKPVICGLNNSS